MRRFLIALTFLMATVVVMGEGIDRGTALKKAQKFMPGRQFTEAKAVPSARAKSPRKHDAFYVFNASNDGGFVIVSGDDRTTEILGYSEHGNLDVDQLPENLKWWLDSYARQIEAVSSSQVPAAKHADNANSAIDPLIKSKWSQSNPFNYMCPDGSYVDYDEEGYNPQNRCLTGCTATAMAQVMYYWKWPKSCPELDYYWVDNHKIKGLPATTFQWDKMKDTYAWKETGEAADAVAKLMRYCGQSVHMDYSPDASGASYSPSVMASTFQYSANNRLLMRDNYTTREWESVIYDELAAQRPVLYDGHPTEGSGHAFIIDGYDGYGLFHINWGWWGNRDSYFVLSIAEGYSLNQRAIINLKPAEDGEVMIPAISGTISDEITTSTYTRPSATDNFTDISLKGSVTASYTLKPSSTLGAEIGWGLYQEENLVKELGSKEITIPAQSSAGFDNSQSVSFGADIADGKYEIVPIYRLAGDTDWKRCDPADTRRLQVEIASKSLTIGFAKVDVISFIVNSITTSEEPEVNREVTVNANITNTCDKVDVPVGLWIQKPDDSQWTYIGATTVIIAKEYQSDATMTFVPTEAGVHQMKITVGSSEEALQTATIKIAATDTVVVDGVAYACTPDYKRARVIRNTQGGSTQKNVIIQKSMTDGSVSCNVIEIEDEALSKMYAITSLTIPESVRSIGERIVWNCTYLQTVNVSYTEPPVISDNAFVTHIYNKEIKQYENVPSPATLYVPIGTKAKYEAILGWTMFAKIDEGEGKEAMIGELKYAYNTHGSTAKVIQDNSYKQFSSIVIPATVIIDNKTYRVTEIDDNAFYTCTNVKSLTLSEGLESIGSSAFACLFILPKLELPSSLKRIGEKAFNWNEKLETVVSHITDPFVINDNTFALEQKNDGEWTPSPATLFIPFGTRAKYEAIHGWTMFANIEEGELKEIKVGELKYSYSTGGNTATVIQDISYKQLSSVEIPSTVIIGNKIYRVTAVGEKAFYDCKNIKTLTLNEGLETIKKSAFSGAYNILEVKLPSTMKTLGIAAFYNCIFLKSLTLNEGLETIGASAFKTSARLGQLELPSTLSSIGDYAFDGSYLTEVFSHITEPPVISDKVFASEYWNEENQQSYWKPSPATLYVPIGTKSKYEAILGWTQFAKIEESDMANTNIRTMELPAAADGTWYNLKGIKENNPRKGIFIRNGRKVLVK